jgi:hypothetical protein
MAGYFYCCHCGKRTRSNPRLKDRQKYCGAKSCQQSRKNKWEIDKLHHDDTYRERRIFQKFQWRKKRPSHRYQSSYREDHEDYVDSNRKKQQIRNKNIPGSKLEGSSPNIVKTDALTSVPLIRCGLYELLPYNTGPGKKIVKTDALIVELLSCIDMQKVLVSDSG